MPRYTRLNDWTYECSNSRCAFQHVVALHEKPPEVCRCGTRHEISETPVPKLALAKALSEESIEKPSPSPGED